MKGKLFLIVFCISIATCIFASGTDVSQRTKEFPKYKCKLTLPGPDYKWINHTMIPNSIAAFSDSSSSIVVSLLVMKNIEDSSIDTSFATYFDGGFFEVAGDAEKISSELGEFKSVPCYSLFARHLKEGFFSVNKVFAANGSVYTLQIVSESTLKDNKAKLDPLFSSFEFIGDPVVPLNPGLLFKKLTQNKSFVILSVCTVIAVVILRFRDRLRRIKYSKSQRYAAGNIYQR